MTCVLICLNIISISRNDTKTKNTGDTATHKLKEMLKENISVIGQDKSGRSLTLKNTTGLTINGRETGYGPGNGEIGDILGYILEFSRLESNLVSRIRINPQTEYPVLNNVLNGYPFQVNSGMFEEQTESGASMFSDGVINVDSYSVWTGLSNVEIVKGESYIVGADFTEALKGNAIQVGDVIYQIDTTKSSVANQILYITGVFQEDATEFDILYQGNTKALLQAVTDNQHAYITAKVSDIPELQQKLFTGKLNEALHYKIAAMGFVKHCADWHKANSLIIAASRVLNKILASW